MKLAILPVTPFQQNCSLIVCEATNKAALIDPGGELDRLLGAVAEAGATLEKILVTHGHLDHCGAAAELAARTGAPIEGPHRDDAFWIEMLAEQGKRYGFKGSQPFTPDRWLEDGDEVTVGELRLTVRHCPGHTPGHVVLIQPEQRLAFVGDVLFKGSVGRTDFPRGSFEQLADSIVKRLWPAGDDVRFVPGHGPMSTFGAERRSNPFVSDSALARR